MAPSPDGLSYFKIPFCLLLFSFPDWRIRSWEQALLFFQHQTWDSETFSECSLNRSWHSKHGCCGEMTKRVVGFVLVKCSDMPLLNLFETSNSERPCVHIPMVLLSSFLRKCSSCRVQTLCLFVNSSHASFHLSPSLPPSRFLSVNLTISPISGSRWQWSFHGCLTLLNMCLS